MSADRARAAARSHGSGCRGREGAAAVLVVRHRRYGAVQPEREKFIAEHGNNAVFTNGIQARSVAPNGEVQHVYA